MRRRRPNGLSRALAGVLARVAATAAAALCFALASCAEIAPVQETMLRIAAPVHAHTPAPAPEPDWRLHFDDLSKGGVLVDLGARRLHYWAPADRGYRSFPIGVPQAPEFARTGRTTIVRRREDPDWRPTPSMLARAPELPRYVAPGPDNPLGTRALYLGWRYYAIHGTNDPGSIGRATTSGCIRLFNEHVVWLYDAVELGAPVHVVERLGAL